jgi:hypothetical protein
MSSTSETGHAKNVANYEKFIADVTALGATYNPSKANLKLTALNTQLTAAKTAISAVNTAETAYKNAVGARDAAFKQLDKLITRVSNALKASDTTRQVIADATTLVRKLQGRRATPRMTDAEKLAAEAQGKKVVEVSASQRSYDNRLDNFDRLIKLLTSVPAYAPNEADLKVVALTTLYNDLKAKTGAVTFAEVSLNNSRINRNDLLYKPSAGVVDTTVDMKTYVKSVYGTSSPQYKALSGMKFTSPG